MREVRKKNNTESQNKKQIFFEEKPLYCPRKSEKVQIIQVRNEKTAMPLFPKRKIREFIYNG